MSLNIFSSAKEEAKSKLLTALKNEVEDPGFDIISFAGLLSQEDGGDDGVPNPLHSCFNRSIVAKASLFIKACALVDQALRSEAEENSIAAPESDDDAASTSEQPEEINPEIITS